MVGAMVDDWLPYDYTTTQRPSVVLSAPPPVSGRFISMPVVPSGTCGQSSSAAAPCSRPAVADAVPPPCFLADFDWFLFSLEKLSQTQKKVNQMPIQTQVGLKCWRLLERRQGNGIDACLMHQSKEHLKGNQSTKGKFFPLNC